MNGDYIIPFAKMSGMTSFSSLSVVKKLLSTKKVGHTGTLDSFADGLLVLVTGKMTHLASFIEAKNKEYENEINGLLENYRAVLDENASYRYEAAQTQEVVYNNIRDIFTSSQLGIENWIALWGSKYKGVYSYWKTEDPNNILYDMVNGKGNIKIDAETLKIIRANIYDWQDKYIRQIVREYDAVLQQYVSEILRLQNIINKKHLNDRCYFCLDRRRDEKNSCYRF